MSTSAGPKTVLVAGATGRFGPICDLLLAGGHRVRAMTRAPESAAARKLRAKGAEPVFGDFDDPASIAAAARGADALFATGTAHRAGPEGELQHGRNLSDAVAAAGIPHLVFVSGDGAAADSPIPLFRAKRAVEDQIEAAGVPHTILAPTYFMENLFNPWNLGALAQGLVPSPIPVQMPIQQTAVADLLALATFVIERADEFIGKRIELASDAVSGEEAAAVISRVTGRHFDAGRLPAADLPPGLRAMFGWLEHRGHRVELQALWSRYPEVGWHTYESWARSQLARFRGLCPHPEPVPSG